MFCRYAHDWISIAVLTICITAPLRGDEVKSAAYEVTGKRAMAEMVWDGMCRPEPDVRVWTGMNAPSDAKQSCSADRDVLIGAAEFCNTDWTADRFEAGSDTPELGVASLNQISSEQAASVVVALASVTPEKPPAATKVPEPATLVLLGAGMIATSGLSRIKRQPKRKLRVAAARLGAVLQH